MSVFESYDIRGVFPKEINEEFSYKLGRLIPKLLKCKNVVVGYDVRVSSKKLFTFLTKGLLEENVKVTSVNACTTPMLYFASFFYKFDAAIMVTASHLNKEYNGFKICSKDAVALGYDSIGWKLEKNINRSFKTKKTNLKVKNLDLSKDYENFILNNFKKTNLKVVVDSANMMGYLDSKILAKVCTVKNLFDKPDGKMPNHEDNPLIEKNLKYIIKEMKEGRYDLGVAFDGDCDRVVFIDEEGSIIRSDLIAALISKYLPKGKIILDSRSSKIVEGTYLGKTIRSVSGHTNIKTSMRKHQALYGSELSGHHFFKEFHYADNALLAVLYILKIMDKEKKVISELVKPFKKYFVSGELNFDVKDKDEKIMQVKDYFKNYRKIQQVDGLSLYFDDFWFNLRKSNTEDLLRLNIEADSEDKLKEVEKTIIKIINH